MLVASVLMKILPIAIGAMSAAVFYVLLRNKATPLSSVEDFKKRTAGGKPTFLRFFKNT